MNLLIISDIHANLEALEALAEPYDELWVLGDLVNYGPDPGAVVDFVRERATLVVRGNHDHAVAYGADPRSSTAFREMAAATCRFTTDVLTDDQKQYFQHGGAHHEDGVKNLALPLRSLKIPYLPAAAARTVLGRPPVRRAISR